MSTSKSARAWAWIATAAAAALVALAPGAQAGKPGGGGTADPRIAFFLGSSGRVSMSNVDGSNVTTVVSGIGGPAAPHWSPDGTRMAFNGSTSSGGDGIYVVHRDGTGLLRVATTATQWVGGPAWSPVPSPDGSYRILFEDVGLGSDGHRDVFAVNLDGTGRVNLTRTADASETGVTWSPDATQFAAVVGWNDGTAWGEDVFVYDVGAPGGTLEITGSRNATAGTALAHSDLADPDWARTKGVLALQGVKAGGKWGLFLLDLENGATTGLGATNGFNEYSPSWSPDDSQIVFRRTSTVTRETGVYVMAAAGTGVKKILDSPASLPDWRR